MNVNPTAAYRAYNKVTEYNYNTRPAEFRPEEPAVRNENTDQIQISPEGARKMEVEQVSRSLLAEIHEAAAPERLENLRAEIQAGKYYVPTSSLVNAVMQNWSVA